MPDAGSAFGARRGPSAGRCGRHPVTSTSSRTSRAKSSPLAAYDAYQSNDAHAGDKITVSPGRAASAAARTTSRIEAARTTGTRPSKASATSSAASPLRPLPAVAARAPRARSDRGSCCVHRPRAPHVGDHGATRSLRAGSSPSSRRCSARRDARRSAASCARDRRTSQACCAPRPHRHRGRARAPRGERVRQVRHGLPAKLLDRSELGAVRHHEESTGGRLRDPEADGGTRRHRERNTTPWRSCGEPGDHGVVRIEHQQVVGTLTHEDLRFRLRVRVERPVPVEMIRTDVQQRRGSRPEDFGERELEGRHLRDDDVHVVVDGLEQRSADVPWRRPH